MNATEGIFTQFERDELNRITAKSILEKLMNIRQNIDVEFIARRLVWELIQNAKDNVGLCNSTGGGVDVSIEIKENAFIFSHNRGYFTNEHIRGLIRKYSSSDKDRDPEQIGKVYKTTGRFGTGFMTTHLLSEKVQVVSYYKKDTQAFNKFSFWLDRSGKGEKDIVKGINNAFAEAEQSIRSSESVNLDESDFQTSFIYPLKGKKLDLALLALEEVKKGIAYTLINVPEINSVTIKEELTGSTSYSIRDFDSSPDQDSAYSFYNLRINGRKSKHSFICAKEDELRLILPVSYKDDKYYCLQLDEGIPRLHLDFPMIGTEDLHLPFLVNSPLFEPTEPRDGVSLIDDDDSEISKQNCDTLLRAINLYINFLEYVGSNENWFDLYNLAKIKYPKKHPWIDYDWFVDNVVEPIRKKLLYTSLVDVVSGDRISLYDEAEECQVYIPSASLDVIRERIWKLSKNLYPQNVPVKEHMHEWYQIIWKEKSKFTMTKLSEEIQAQQDLVKLKTSLTEGTEALKFLNDYYDLLNIEGLHIKEIGSDEFAVIPNQLGSFMKKSQLSIDEDIDDEIKNACSFISNNPREYLIMAGAHTGNGIRYSVKKQDDIVAEINNIIKEGKNESISSACDYLTSLFPPENIPEKRTLLYEFSKRVYPDDFTEKRILKNYEPKIWEESDKNSIFYIVSKISECQTVDNSVTEFGFPNPEVFLTWLNTFVTFVVKEGFDKNINRDKHPILPDQNGVFKTKDDLFLDDGEIGDALKDISAELGHDYRKDLLDTSIYLELPENRTYTIENVAEKISTLIKPMLRDIDKRKEFKETLKKFYLWMNENKQKAELYFSDLYEKRFFFLEDEDISLNMKKATEFDKLMKEHGITSIEELGARLSQLKNMPPPAENEELEKTIITKENLASLGVTSPQELEQAFKDPAISSRFYHTSTPTTEMYNYAQALIERAKQNIISFLKQHPDYDCTDMEETAPTTLVGIVKKGVAIQIVTRPSDHGEVIIYYSSETDTLDSDNAELWVDNAISDPHILTLGRILKSTGITKIPINMN